MTEYINLSQNGYGNNKNIIDSTYQIFFNFFQFYSYSIYSDPKNIKKYIKRKQYCAYKIKIMYLADLRCYCLKEALDEIDIYNTYWY